MEADEWTAGVRAVRRRRHAGRGRRAGHDRGDPRRAAPPTPRSRSAPPAAARGGSRRARFRSSPREQGSSGAMVLFWPLGEQRGLAVKLKVWGARGSVPSPGPQMNRYGGNTSCVQLTLASGEELILDAGTGIRNLGLDLARRAPHPHPAHPPAPRPHPGADVLPALLPRRVGDHDLGAVLARGIARGPDRPLHLRPALAGRGPRAARARSPSATRRRASGSSAERRFAPRRSPIAARRSATGSPTARRRSPTSPTTSRRWGRRSRVSSPSGSRASTSPATPTC